MRLIDADALLYDLEIVPLTDDGGVDANDLDDIIKRQPTIEERKPGRWVLMSDNSGYYHCCSWCGHEGFNGMKFCPNCGAKVEAESDTWNKLHEKIAGQLRKFDDQVEVEHDKG